MNKFRQRVRDWYMAHVQPVIDEIAGDSVFYTIVAVVVAIVIGLIIGAVLVFR